MNKQIEEMVKDLREAQHAFDVAWTECLQNKGRLPERENVFYATHLYNAGYRKQSEGEWKYGRENGQWGYYCTNCKAGFTGENAEWIAKSHDYCPECGAKMKGENK